MLILNYSPRKLIILKYVLSFFKVSISPIFVEKAKKKEKKIQFTPFFSFFWTKYKDNLKFLKARNMI